MPRVVLDTNVLVSGILSEHGPPGWIVDLIAAGDLEVAHDSRILAEYHEVLTRSRLKLSVYRVQTLLDVIRETGVPVTPLPWQVPLPDPDDEPFLATANMAAAPLVTGKIRHFPEELRFGVPVLSPRQFFERLRG